MPSFSTQARNKGEVLSNFEMHDTPFISLWQCQPHTLIFVLRDGDPEKAKSVLQQNIDMLIRSKSWAQYMVKYHDESDLKKDKINNNTPYVGSCVFKLDECMPEEYKQGSVGSVQSYEIQQLREQIAGMQEEEEEEEPILRTIRSIGAAIDDSPTLSNIAYGLIEKFFKVKIPAQEVNRESQMGHSVAGETKSDTMEKMEGTVCFEMLEDKEREQITNAIDVLLNIDKDFCNTITELANLAKTKPAKYNLAKSML